MDGVRAAFAEARTEWDTERDRMRQELEKAQTRAAQLASTTWSESAKFKNDIGTAAHELLRSLPASLQEQMNPYLGLSRQA
ncbi:MAG: hypothetical protein E6R04_02905 [Spirochaetes bacterium]|nr:MAG: hypothetical protein E6R04_02905 [Spirochaetota bacterium]